MSYRTKLFKQVKFLHIKVVSLTRGQKELHLTN